MPDLERFGRQIEIDLASTEEEKDKIRAYYKGLDRGRWDVCGILIIILVVAAVIAFALI